MIKNLVSYRRGRSIFVLLFVGQLCLAQSIQDDIKYLSSDALEGREIGTHGAQLASTYIATRFSSLGLLPKGGDGYFQDLKVKPRYNPHAKFHTDTSRYVHGRNVLGMIDNHAPTTIVIGAHFDHLGYGNEGSLYQGDSAIHNGADDNASGVALLLQLAKWLPGKYTNNNYLFIAFTGEEKGLWGSNWFVKHPTIDLNQVNYMINMDMVGRLNAERSLAVYGTGTSPAWMPILESLAKKQGFKLKSMASGVGPSDHTSFYLQDIPVLHFFTGQHEDYHKPSDDFDKINYSGMQDVLGFIEAVIADVDDHGKLTFTKTKEDESEKAPKFSVTLGVIPDYMFDGKGMRIDGVRDDHPAQRAGILKGDVVVKMGDLDITDMMSYMKGLSNYHKGDKVKVTVKRDEELVTVDVVF